MHLRTLTLLITFCLTLFIPACSGGGTSGTASIKQVCGSSGTNLFCMTSCNLGCSNAGCNINRIAQNEPIELIFNQDVDKFSVPPYTTSILLRTANGEEPVGDWLVNGRRITFVPGVLISGAKTFFGFRPNETYTLFMPSGDDQPDVVKSMGGDRLSSSITCTLNIGAIKDLNQAPPAATLIVPQPTEGVELDTNIVLEFNEIIDPAIFVGITPATSPIRYSVKSASVVNGKVLCRTASEAVLLPGIPRMTIDPARGTSIVSFKPKENLPGKKCVEIEVSSQVKDLAGVFAKPHTLSFTTKDVGVQIFSNVEDFTNSQFLDKDLSAGTWGNGSLTFSPIGGSGKHGEFTPSLGKDISDPRVKVAVYEWDLDKAGGIKIPKNLTTTGKDEFITDGKFEFSKLEIPDGVEVHFIGSIPARIWVRGVARVGGLLAANGQSIDVNSYLKSNANGEAGGTGGAMGGAGGVGGDQGDGVAHKTDFDGKPGQSVKLLSGHMYSTRFAGSGGEGSPQFPVDGKSSSVTFTYFNVISQQSNRGGGGAGFLEAGGLGFVKWDQPANQKYAAPGNTPGGKFGSFPSNFPNYTNGFTPQDHYVAGGSGGGGSGSSCGGAIKSVPAGWWGGGRGGHGGGGAIAIRVGGSLVLPASGRIQAQGGSGALDEANFSTRGMPAGGGGGSGGALFLQVNQATQNSGSISVKGGDGGRTFGHFSDQVYSGMKSYAGNGSHGILHFQTTQDPSNYPVGSTIPASPPIAKLGDKDKDDIVALRSLWYAASLLFPPDFKRYELEVLEDNVRKLYSDDPAVGDSSSPIYDKDYAGLATSGKPVQFTVQGAKLELDPSGKLARIPNTPNTGFRKYVGSHSTSEPTVADDGATGYRFELMLDRAPGKAVVVKQITVYWEL